MVINTKMAIPYTAVRRFFLLVVLFSVGFLSYIGITQIVENAFAATTITVNSLLDTTGNDGVCTLREAITAANSDTASGAAVGECAAGSGSDTIIFSITGTITPASQLPIITTTVTIDGTTQVGASCSARTLLVEINAVNETYGLNVSGNNFVLRGLAINRAGFQHGVRILNASNPTIECNNLGTDVTGVTAGIGNAQDGIALENVTGGTVGSTTLANRNIMAGNGQAGIELVGTTNGVSVIGNYIGTNFAGTSALGNIGRGVAIWGATGNTIGGTASGERNIISGNVGIGVEVDADNVPTSATGNTIAGNYIGTQPDGTTALANTTNGIQLQTGSGTTTIGGTTGVTVGGNCTGACNVISGNSTQGISINGSSNNTVLGNYIGTNAAGTGALPNGLSGVSIGDSSSSNTIGGTASGARNVISGNTSNGIFQNGTGSSNTFLGNYIGTNALGSAALANGTDGFGYDSNGTGNVLGGTASGSRNIVSGNAHGGVVISQSGITVQGNYLGLNATGDSVVANGGAHANLGLLNATNVTVGGNTAAARNVIAGPSSRGIQILGASPFGGGPTTGIKIQGNYIGTDANGVNHAGFGAVVAMFVAIDAQNNLIGGTGAGEGNLITGNGGGIGVSDFASFEALNNSILGNSIYNNTGGAGATTIGIDLMGVTNDGTTFTSAGVTANDAGDGDVTSNHLMNFPVISSVSSSNGAATITYSLDINDAEAGATGYRVEFFANDAADPSGNGQGQTIIGSDIVAGDVSGRSVTITLPSGVSGSKFISATNTMTDASADGFGHTSEFGPVVSASLAAVTSTAPDNNAGLSATGDNSRSALYFALALITCGIAGATVRRKFKKLVA